MDVATTTELLERVTRALSQPGAKGNLLDEIGWSREVEEEFFAHGATRLPEVTYAVDEEPLERATRDLDAVAKSIEGDEPVHRWLRAAVGSAIDRNRMLLALGTKDFGRLSLEIYGGASSRFFGLEARNIDLADHLLDRLRLHGWDEATDREEEPLDAETFAADLRRRIAKQRPAIDIDVVVDARLAAKAIAGMSKVRVRADATFLPWEADGLFGHEVETHAFTARNGASQPHAPFLKSGGPRTTPAQEGLAVFAELYNHTLAAPRLERLAVRVKLVALAEDGASFLDLYRWLLERGLAPRDAYLDAARVCRGGPHEGGAPFTKDASYLAGLLHVYAFLSAFVRGGFRDETELIVAGRIALEDIGALVQLRNMGLLARPRHRPRWLRRWSTLLPHFAFASFMDAIDLRPVEAHYRELIELAGSAAPPPSR